MTKHITFICDNLSQILYKKILNGYSFVDIDDESSGDQLIVFAGSALVYEPTLLDKLIKKSQSYKKIEIFPFSFHEHQNINKNNWLNEHDVTLRLRERKSFLAASKYVNNGYESKKANIRFDHDPLLKSTIQESVKNDKKCAVFYREKYNVDDNVSIIDYSSLDSYEKIESLLSEYHTIYTNHIELAFVATLAKNNVILFNDRYLLNSEVYNHSLYKNRNVSLLNIPPTTENISTSSNNVSIVCACMNRNEILSVNIYSWLKFEQVSEIIIVDWSSSQSLEYLKDIDSRIKIVRVDNKEYFNISQAYNLGIHMASQDYVLKMDTDYMLNPYYNFFDLHPQPKQGFFYAGDWIHLHDDTLRFLCGLCYAKKSDILSINGYNENFEGYGFDDSDLYSRLISNGLIRLDICYNHCILHIPHPVSERTKNYKVKTVANGKDNWNSRHKPFVPKKWHINEIKERYYIAKEDETHISL